MSLYEAPDTDMVFLKARFLEILKSLRLIRSKIVICSHTTVDASGRFTPTQYEITFEPP